MIFVYLGTGEHASQQGMNIGGIRHASDIKADDMTSQSQGMLHPQTGMYIIFVGLLTYLLVFLNIKHLEYLNRATFSLPAYPQYVELDQLSKVELMKTVFMSVLTGTGEHASQQGMNIGGIRHASDIKADDMTSQSQGMLHPQTGMLSFVITLLFVYCIVVVLFSLKY